VCNGGPVRQPEQIPAFVPSLFINIPMGGGRGKGRKERKEKKRKECILSFFEFWFWWDVSFARVAYF